MSWHPPCDNHAADDTCEKEGLLLDPQQYTVSFLLGQSGPVPTTSLRAFLFASAMEGILTLLGMLKTLILEQVLPR
jgi:hypothetical protein